ncbi:BTB/POZ domain-containing protein 7 [Aphomia sociella]
MSRLLCCLCARHADMGAALSHPQEGEACDGAVLPAAPPTMADVIRERKKKAGGAGLGTLRRRIAAAARRPRDSRPDRGCEHARFIRSVVSSWRLAEVFLLCEELEAGAALRDLVTQAELAREPANALQVDLAAAYRDRRWCDVELVGAGWALAAHRCVLAARAPALRALLARHQGPRVPLEGAAAQLSRGELERAVAALYGARCGRCDQWDRGGSVEGDLDVVENTNGSRGAAAASSCRCGAAEPGLLRRLTARLGCRLDAVHHDMRYLLDSGELSDARLVFRLEGGGAAYGFRSALELPCHRLLLAARSRFFRSVMSRRGTGPGGAVCVDEKVLPRRFARALLHAAYTDQVDLTLIGRNSSSPSSTNSVGSGGAPWSSGGRGNRGGAMLEDAFQLYEIARFLEMPIVVQGCEDAVVEALAADTLPAVLRWAAQPHASQWVHRQAMRYLRDEFPSVMCGSAAALVPRAALAAALASPFLQASEPQALRALLRWAERAAQALQPAQATPAHEHREPNVVWHTAGAGGAGPPGARRGRRRSLGDAALRELLAALLPHVRLEHLPPDHELLHQGALRPPRCFLPYLDELKALLEDQAVPEAELARARRAKYLHRIPDTLYMVAAARGGGAGSPGGADGAAAACVSPRALHALRARARELLHAPPAARALRLHAHDASQVTRQIALRAVREMSLPDACAELLLNDLEAANERSGSGGGIGGEGGAGTARCSSAGSLRSQPSLHIPIDPSRAGTCRREVPSRGADGHRQPSSTVCRAGTVVAGGAGVGGRLSAAVPDVAMAPNANTHLLTAPNYFRHAPPPEFSGGVLQLDLGDGATHTPRPGSRAARAMAAQHAGRQREQAQQQAAFSLVRTRADDDELRAAIDLSLLRAYSSFHPRAPSPPQPQQQPPRCRPAAATLPHCYRGELQPTAAGRSRATPSPSSLSASNSGHLSAKQLALSRVGSAGSAGARWEPRARGPLARRSRARGPRRGGGAGLRDPQPQPEPQPQPAAAATRLRAVRATRLQVGPVIRELGLR